MEMFALWLPRAARASHPGPRHRKYYVKRQGGAPGNRWTSMVRSSRPRIPSALVPEAGLEPTWECARGILNSDLAIVLP
jgi:hypothetical protein